MTEDRRRFAPATERNRDFILPILRRLLPAAGTVLEIGSGTGEHAVYFAGHLPELDWQPTETDEPALESIAAWRAHAGLANVAPPVRLDVRRRPWPVAHAVAVVAINVVHYSPWSSTDALFQGAAEILPAGAVLYLYGPYRRGGRHTAPSNAAFDEWLRGVDPGFGVRDLEAVEAAARAHGFGLEEVIDMPANNLSLVFRRA
ncbi:DUF938 domain-containing protein [Thauera sinica]|uniref:DUF938 domain-containing protein n=1 Tax=Thauera sinica TaxID=2665146 RepID=A0ABW1AQ83_9RHOO|nr:DUF938 domain-containing protein [Thauera sp. K11]ATE59463.1 SAM-dependent methyltransferase [Thauera sp. K11]